LHALLTKLQHDDADGRVGSERIFVFASLIYQLQVYVKSGSTRLLIHGIGKMHLLVGRQQYDSASKTTPNN
jgi:hypothetical protein